MKNIKKTISLCLALSCISLFGMSSAFPLDVQSPGSAVEIRGHLVTLIDSLDIEKQLRKRTGKSIDDIEHQQSIYLDSLNSLRKTIQNGLTVSEKRAENPYSISFNSFAHPITFFDWLIVVTSAVAILSSLILISGIFRAATRKMQPKSKTTQPIKNKPQYLVNHKVKDDSDGKKILSQLETESINQLRNKIKNDAINYDTSNPRAPTQILKATIPLPQQSPTISDLETQIFQAFQKGSDIQELSRKFQISTDHVSLILKIKGSSPKK